MTTEGALRAGAGLVEVFVPEEIYEIVAAAAPVEAMVKPVRKYRDLLDEEVDVWALGPGLGKSRASEILNLIENAQRPMIVDADGLNILADKMDILRSCRGQRLLTPHPGEMKRMMDVGKMVDRKFDNTDAALEHVFDGGWFGGVGLVILPDLIIAGYSENWLSEDGSNRIGLIDRRTGGLVGQIEMALVGPGTRQLTSPCPSFPVPFVSPTPPPVVPFLSLDLAFGCWPDPEGLALAHGSDGKTYLVSGNGGTEDISLMDLDKALAGVKVVEVAPRIPVQTGPFGIKASPNGRFVAVTARESNRVDFEGNTISIIEVDRVIANARRRPPVAGPETRVRVGNDESEANGGARPFNVAWTPDGKSIVVANFRTNNVSIVDLKQALAAVRRLDGEVARIPLVRPDGQPARPKGIAVTADGRYAVVSGGARQAPTAPASGTVFVIDLRTHRQVATVTGVGNDPYGLTIVDRLGDD